jgi:hypothetical protein
VDWLRKIDHAEFVCLVVFLVAVNVVIDLMMIYIYLEDE